MNQLTVEQLQTAYSKIFYNAEELIKESKVLFDSGAKTRAFTLSHLACEELAKLPLVYHTATKVLFKQKVDWKDFRRRFQDHKEKLKNVILVANMIVGNKIDGEKFEEMKAFVTAANELKNQSLYTGFYDNEFQKPSECVSEGSIVGSYKLANMLLDFFADKNLHLSGGILNSLKDVTEVEFDRSNELSTHNAVYTPDGKIYPYYVKKHRNELKQKQKKRNQKLRKKKKKK
ncbi:AbiV family abortive infection protein [Bacillus tropicus]|uniref:AbiV family abortive infection protein n=1 Tax=Bacillus cereus group TaxID=86661 RepID=UPI001CFC95D2|nr:MULTISPECIES: AbiV family abortive infection protein [Bacillus cereus group]MCB4848588.1 AbiV family abortive infection protein [Bacillus tropicus]